MPSDNNQQIDQGPSPIRTEGGVPVRRASPADPNAEVRRATPANSGDDPTPYPSPDFPEGASQQYKDALQQEWAMRKQWQQDESMLQKEQAWAKQKEQEMLSQPMPRMPSFDETHPQPLPPWQTTQQAKDLKHKYMWALAAYAAIAIPLAAFAGRRGGRPGRGLREGLNAINEGFGERAYNAGAIWKAQNDLLIKHGEDLMSYYKDIIQNRKTNTAEKRELIGLTAEFWKDKTTADKAMLDDWHQVVTHLAEMDKLVESAKRWRVDHEPAIMKEFGLDATHKDYLQRIIEKYPDLRDGLMSDDRDAYRQAHDKGASRYSWSQFLKDKDKEIADEAKARKDAGLELPGETSEDSGQQTKDMTPEDKGKLNNFARKLRGEQ